MQSVKGRKIVVIGGGGLLGSASVEAALAATAEVVVLSRSATPQGGAKAISGSIADADTVRQALAGASGVVISVDAGRTPEQLHAVFVGGTQNVLTAASRDVHVIFMSHIGITKVERMPEYNLAKLKAEELIRNSGFPYTIIRPSWVVSGQTGVKLEQGDHYVGRRDDVGHGDLGAAVVAAFENEEARRKTFELYGGGRAGSNWAELYGQLIADTESRGDLGT